MSIRYFSRIQWSVKGATIYYGDGSFMTRIEDDRDIDFLNRCIISSLKKIKEEAQKRRTFHAVQEPETTSLDAQQQTRDGEEMGSGNTEKQAASGEGKIS